VTLSRERPQGSGYIGFRSSRRLIADGPTVSSPQRPLAVKATTTPRASQVALCGKASAKGASSGGAPALRPSLASLPPAFAPPAQHSSAPSVAASGSGPTLVGLPPAPSRPPSHATRSSAGALASHLGPVGSPSPLSPSPPQTSPPSTSVFCPSSLQTSVCATLPHSPFDFSPRAGGPSARRETNGLGRIHLGGDCPVPPPDSAIAVISVFKEASFELTQQDHKRMRKCRAFAIDMILGSTASSFQQDNDGKRSAVIYPEGREPRLDVCEWGA